MNVAFHTKRHRASKDRKPENTAAVVVFQKWALKSSPLEIMAASTFLY